MSVESSSLASSDVLVCAHMNLLYLS